MTTPMKRRSPFTDVALGGGAQLHRPSLLQLPEQHCEPALQMLPDPVHLSQTLAEPLQDDERVHAPPIDAQSESALQGCVHVENVY